MFDVNEPWSWTKDKKMSAPLGGLVQASQEQQAAPAMPGEPGMGQQMQSSLVGGVLNEGLKSAEAGMAKDATAQSLQGVLGGGAQVGIGSQAQMLADQTIGMGGAGISATAEAAAGATGASTALGPLGAAAGGLAKGNYGEAAGAAAGATIGNMLLPGIGGAIGSKLGGSVMGGK